MRNRSRPTPPDAKPPGFLTWWLKPAGVVFLAVAVVVLGAVGVPALSRPAPPDDDEPEVETAQPVEWRAAFDLPAAAPRLPSATGPYAVSAVIDREIDKALRDARVTASPAAGDAEFFRRVHLDLVGRVPSLAATREFLGDADPTKRSRAVEALLASPEHGRYLARLWADLLVKRDPDNARDLPTGPFVDWLAKRFNEGAKWDAIVTDMVCAQGDAAKAPETFFIAAHQDNKQASPAKLAGAVGNLFMGVQIQCAECHRHPYHEKWTPDDFWGVAAFFGQTRLDRGLLGKLKKNGPLAVRESGGGRLFIKAVRANAAGLRINVPDPNDPRKVTKVATGKFFESDEPVPAGRGPYRPALTKWLTGRSNPYFARAAVNRFWAHFFARGLHDPIDEMHDPAKATHPALLDALAAAFRDSGHDLKFLFRAIVNSHAYQRTSRPAGGNEADETLYGRMPLKVMNAWQLVGSISTVTGGRLHAETVRSLDTREADEPVTDFGLGIPQILKLMNTPLTASSAAVAAKIAKDHGGDHAAGLEECFLLTLTRKPRPEEVERLSRYVAAKGPEKGYAGVLWALLNSAEFLSNR